MSATTWPLVNVLEGALIRLFREVFGLVIVAITNRLPIERGRPTFLSEKAAKKSQCVRTGGVHTITCCTHIFMHTARSVRTSHIFMRVTHTDGSRSCKRCLLHSHVSFSLLMRLRLLFLLPNFPDPKARVKRTLHEDEQFGHLAKSVPNTRQSVLRLDQQQTFLSWTHKNGKKTIMTSKEICSTQSRSRKEKERTSNGC